MGCRGLQELVLKYCQKIGDEGLVEVGKGCSQLQALHLVDCSSIGDVAMRSIALGCHQLRRLHIRRCYKVSIRLQYHIQLLVCMYLIPYSIACMYLLNLVFSEWSDCGAGW